MRRPTKRSATIVPMCIPLAIGDSKFMTISWNWVLHRNTDLWLCFQHGADQVGNCLGPPSKSDHELCCRSHGSNHRGERGREAAYQHHSQLAALSLWAAGGNRMRKTCEKMEASHGITFAAELPFVLSFEVLGLNGWQPVTWQTIGAFCFHHRCDI